ncbi:hypothetical protein Tco_0885034 [Tanacetum coccineum]
MEAKLASDVITFDTDVYNADNRFQGYNTEIPLNDDDETADAMNNELAMKMASYSPHKSMMNDIPHGADDKSLLFRQRDTLLLLVGIRRLNLRQGGYAEIMREAALKREKDETLKDQSQDKESGAKKAKSGSDWDMPDSIPGIGRWDATPTPGRMGDATPSLSQKNRWDETPTPGRVTDSVATPVGGVTPGATPADMA